MSAILGPRMTLQAYLDWEESQKERHELVDGEVFEVDAMTGGRRVHGRVQVNLSTALHNRLSGGPCQVFADSSKVQAAPDAVVYPDVFVTCDRADLATDIVFRAPLLVVEVLSPGTQAYDRSRKFALYRRIPALREYVLVDPDTLRVEAFRRGDGGVWTFHDMSDDDALSLTSVDCRIPLAEVFAGIDPPAAAQGEGGSPNAPPVPAAGR